MNVKRLLERVPADREAEGRAWAVVRAAYAEREHVRRRPRRPLMLAAVGLAVVVGAAALSPPGRAVVDAVRRTIGISHAAPALFRLPAPGRVLVSGGGGTWVVSMDGSKRRLGDYRQAAWSPHGLYVIAATANELAALEPSNGTVRWSLARPNIAFPRWGGSRTDTRVAYLSDGQLRVVAGDGTGDAAVAGNSRVAPTWRPGDRRQLAFVAPLRRAALARVVARRQVAPARDRSATRALRSGVGPRPCAAAAGRERGGILRARAARGGTAQRSPRLRRRGASDGVQHAWPLERACLVAERPLAPHGTALGKSVDLRRRAARACRFAHREAVRRGGDA